MHYPTLLKPPNKIRPRSISMAPDASNIRKTIHGQSLDAPHAVNAMTKEIEYNNVASNLGVAPKVQAHIDTNEHYGFQQANGGVPLDDVSHQMTAQQLYHVGHRTARSQKRLLQEGGFLLSDRNPNNTLVTHTNTKKPKVKLIDYEYTIPGKQYASMPSDLKAEAGLAHVYGRDSQTQAFNTGYDLRRDFTHESVAEFRYMPMSLPAVRNMTPEGRAALIRINKDKKAWYKGENQASLDRGQGKLFKTSFHDYAHSAPTSLTGSKSLGLSNADESIARHMEDSVLQGLPLALPKSQRTPEIEATIAARQQPHNAEAYETLYNLGKYSTAKKNNLDPANILPSKVMLNKFAHAPIAEFATLLQDIQKGRPIAPNFRLPTISTRLQPKIVNNYITDEMIPRGFNHQDIGAHNYNANRLKRIQPELTAERNVARGLRGQLDNLTGGEVLDNGIGITPVPDNLIGQVLENVNNLNGIRDRRDNHKLQLTNLARKYSDTPYNKAVRSGGMFAWEPHFPQSLAQSQAGKQRLRTKGKPKNAKGKEVRMKANDMYSDRIFSYMKDVQ